MDDLKQQTKSIYNCEPLVDLLELKSHGYFSSHLLPDATRFLQELKGKRVLDLASGTGSTPTYFARRGYSPVCVDFAPAVIARCRERTLPACLMDIEHLGFTPTSFDGIWANHALYHLPKENLPSALEQISSVLAPDGVVFLGMREGTCECFAVSGPYQQFMALYTDDELKSLVEPHVTVLQSSRVSLENHVTFLNYLCRKK